MKRMKVERPYQQNEDGSFFFQTMITPGGQVGGQHYTREEIAAKLEEQTGQSGELEYDGNGDLWWVVDAG